MLKWSKLKSIATFIPLTHDSTLEVCTLRLMNGVKGKQPFNPQNRRTFQVALFMCQVMGVMDRRASARAWLVDVHPWKPSHVYKFKVHVIRHSHSLMNYDIIIYYIIIIILLYFRPCYIIILATIVLSNITLYHLMHRFISLYIIWMNQSNVMS